MNSTKSSKSVLGYTPIPPHMVESSLDLAVRWFNNNTFDGVKAFPEDLIESDGDIVFELVTYLAGKPLTFKQNIDQNMKKLEKLTALVKQYDDLIRFLKEQGALLNSIRPEYLLNFHDYNFFLKINANEKYAMSGLKVTENRFKYISADSWLTIFYQILKVYYLSRLQSKMLRAIPNLN